MEALGIQPTLLAAQVVNFLIIVVVLNVLLYKPILAMLDKRKKEIEEGLSYTEKMRQENEMVEQKKAKIIEQARKEGVKIVEEARGNAKVEEKQILDDARLSAEEMIAKGKKTVEEERESMQKGVKKESVTLGILIAKRLLSESVSGDIQHKILAKHIKDIENV